MVPLWLLERGLGRASMLQMASLPLSCLPLLRSSIRLPPTPSNCAITNVALPITVRHNRLGHANYKSIARMASHNVARDITITLSSSSHNEGDHRVFGKQTKTAIPKPHGGRIPKPR
ncbi:hypothetical protein BOTBODRAFT_196340 [Botryobasidium botryosum FD-172 SS1]|uniref:GAG-pre-integrase domain-containing protein n=1 Tax=Botryobasidium botryosum (strain FD-172 SS1) TaxID=930990 RepID=A0A067MZR7_BOTB1|nr:hypothetical protein BOTBODRAFT_196340 [Botryobasidium botryosum FD-172 SS1]